MRNKMVVGILAMVMVIGLLMGCGGGGGGGGAAPPYVAPRYDATGEWTVISTGYSRSCVESNMEFCDACEQIASEFDSYYSRVTVNVNQTADTFNMTVVDTGENFNGDISYDVYSYSDSETQTYQGVTIHLQYYGNIVMDSENHFSGSVEYEIYVDGYGLVCQFIISFEGWRDGVSDPILDIDPQEHDFGYVEEGTIVPHEVTLTNLAEEYGPNMEGILYINDYYISFDGGNPLDQGVYQKFYFRITVPDSNIVLDPGESYVFTCEYEVPEDLQLGGEVYKWQVVLDTNIGLKYINFTASGPSDGGGL